MRKIIILLSVVMLITSCCCGDGCDEDSLKVSREDLVVGNTYLYSRNWSDPNPFDGTMDTVLILEISGDYVKWLSTKYAVLTNDEEQLNQLSSNGKIFNTIHRFRKIPGDSVIEEINEVLDESLEYNSEVLYDIN